jgi:hypothetical protein
MNEAEWNSCTDPTPMLKFLRTSGKLSERKARLFAVACCRRIWPRLRDDRSRTAVEVAERYADGLTTRQELGVACNAANRNTSGAAIRRAVLVTAARVVRPRVAAVYASHIAGNAERDERAAQAALLRDLYGLLPFHPVSANLALLSWGGGTVRRLAEAAYKHRLLPDGTLDRNRLAVLADALEEASCTDAELLAHLRSPGPHVRGCFALDAVLGKS